MLENFNHWPGEALNAVPGGAATAAAVNLVVQNNAGTPASKVDVAADELVLSDDKGQQFRARSVAVTIDIATNGANGLEIGAAEATSTWYYIWALYNPATGAVAGLLSTSATSPKAPADYTYKALVGEVFNASGGDFTTFYRVGNEVWLNITNVFTAKAAGLANTYEPVAGADLTLLQTLIPPRARTLSGVMGTSTGGCNFAIAADANGLGAQFAVFDTAGVTFDSWRTAAPFRGVPLKTAQTFYWKAGDTSASGRVSVSGYST